MFWLQLALSFAIWVVVGILLARRPNPVAVLQNRSRGLRAILASGLLVGFLILLFVPLGFILQRGGFTGGPMTVPIWLVVTLCGASFVVANTLSMAILVGLVREAVVTPEARPASTHKDPHQ